MKKFVQKAKQNYKRLAIVIACMLALYLIFGHNFKVIVVCIAFILIGAFSTFYQYYIKGPVQFELVKFVTIITAVAYGPLLAAMVGIIASISGKILIGKLEVDFIGSILAIIVISFLAQAFASAPIAILGIALVLVYHVIIFPIALMAGGNLGYGVIYSGTNIVFNIFIFNLLGAPVLWLVR